MLYNVYIIFFSMLEKRNLYMLSLLHKYSMYVPLHSEFSALFPAHDFLSK